ncbi:MAG TPA: chemotaxis protein CheB [Flavobacterium sp.]|jgi:two-component system chemotaxis response regulator CheB
MQISKTVETKPAFPQAVVIGASAGGLKALVALIAQLGDDFPIPILMVQHISVDATGSVLLEALQRNSKLVCRHGKNGETLKKGHVYLAPSGHHLMVDENAKILITKGAHENRSRPAIDPLFRSAAVTFGNRLIAILLTGYLDDGTAGMEMIKRCGGACIVQDPEDADYPQMPQHAIENVAVDYVVPVQEMGGLLYKLIGEKLPKSKPLPKEVLIEADIAKRVLSDLPSVNTLGRQVPFNCPGCGGNLWVMEKAATVRFRCHTGHAYTADILLAEQTDKIEETMWTALRMFEERKNLLTTMMEKQNGSIAKISQERINQSQVHIERIRQILQAGDKGFQEDMPV